MQARLAVHLKEVIDRFELTDGRLLGITTDNASSNYSMTCERQWTLEASGIEWPALRNYIPCMVRVIQLALGAFMSSLSVKGSNKSWEAHDCNQQFGENESIDIGKSQRLRKEGNARIKKVSAIRSGLAKIIQIVRILWHFESPETDFHEAENACCIKYADTWLSNRVNWLLTSQSPHCGTSDYGCEDNLELFTRVAQPRLPIMGIHLWVDSKATIHWIPATLHNSGQMDNCKVCHGSVEAIPILDTVDVQEAYRHIVSRHHGVQWHVRSHRWSDASVS